MKKTLLLILSVGTLFSAKSQWSGTAPQVYLSGSAASASLKYSDNLPYLNMSRTNIELGEKLNAASGFIGNYCKLTNSGITIGSAPGPIASMSLSLSASSISMGGGENATGAFGIPGYTINSKGSGSLSPASTTISAGGTSTNYLNGLMSLSGSFRNSGSFSTGTGGISNVHIGTMGSFEPSWGVTYLGFNAKRSSSGSWTSVTDGAHNGGAVIWTSIFGDIYFSSIGTSATGTTNNMYTDNDVQSRAGVRITSQGYLFAKEVQVKTDLWADFVFKKDYKLKSLSEVESFINENNHLPDVPSEADVKENGIKVGEMNALLLQKIEELTLYMIDLKKENESIKSELNALKK